MSNEDDGPFGSRLNLPYRSPIAEDPRNGLSKDIKIARALAEKYSSGRFYDSGRARILGLKTERLI